MGEKVLGLLQKQLTRDEMKTLNVVSYPDRVTLLSVLTFDHAPSVDELERTAATAGEMAEMYCAHHGIRKVLIGGANYLTPFLVHELMTRGLMPVFVWMERKLKGYKVHRNGNTHGEYDYVASGLVEPYSWYDVQITQIEGQ